MEISSPESALGCDVNTVNKSRSTDDEFEILAKVVPHFNSFKEDRLKRPPVTLLSRLNVGTHETDARGNPKNKILIFVSTQKVKQTFYYTYSPYYA